MTIFCGKCLKPYTRKDNWQKHFTQKCSRTDVFGLAANVCYNLEKDHGSKGFWGTLNCIKSFKNSLWREISQ